MITGRPNWNYFEAAYRMLLSDEGQVLRPYRCPAGFLTIGIGHNLDAQGISERAAAYIFSEDVDLAVAAARRIFGAVQFDEEFSQTRQLAIVNLIFNLGEDGFKKFKRMIAACKAANWKQAVYELKYKAPGELTKYAKELPGRCARVCTLLLEEGYPY